MLQEIEPIKPIHHVPSFKSILDENAIWCAPAQICWDTISEKFDVGLTSDAPRELENLASSEFDLSRISDGSYKTEMDVSAANEVSVASTLSREFDFQYPFVPMGAAGFHDVRKDTCRAEYFGFDEDSENNSAIRSQLKILYHGLLEELGRGTSRWDIQDGCKKEFAISIMSEQKDLIILVSRPGEGTAQDILGRAAQRAREYVEIGGRREVKSGDSFKMPQLNISVKDRFPELEGIGIKLDGVPSMLARVEQETSFSLDKAGGRVMSKARFYCLGLSLDPDLKFNFETEFALFVADCSTPGNYEAYLDDDWEKIVPYLAARISGRDWF